MGWDTWESTEDFLKAQLPQAPWLVPGLIPGAGWSLLESPPGVGKSIFAFQLVEALSQGAPSFLAFNGVKQTKCAYIQVDEPLSEWQAQLHGLQAKGASILMARDPELYPLSAPEACLKIKRQLTVASIEFVVWDAAYALSMLDLSKSDSAQRLIGALRSVHAGPFMVLHHTRKPGRDQEYTDSVVTASYGSIFLAASASVVLRLQPDRLEIGKSRLTRQQAFKLTRDPATGRWVVPPPVTWMPKRASGASGLLQNAQGPDRPPALNRPDQ